MSTEIDLQGFYPEYVRIEEIRQASAMQLEIHMRTITQLAKCPECGKESSNLHSHSLRKNIWDLPILGQGVRLTIRVKKYYCRNKQCGTDIFVEPMPGLVKNRGQWTERCVALIMAVAMSTSCESGARICTLMNIPVSGDTVIRMLLRNVRNTVYTGESIGVDDWAFKKGHHYGTIICDMESHLPIALLPGRDGSSLREWLKQNKQVKIVSRDRAGAYAKAISDILPGAVQIADRFHLHHNLMDAVREAVKRIVPEKVWITEQEGSFEETVKKTI
jgi:transposase